MKLKKGDKVRVMAGKDRGKEGAVDKVLPRRGRVVVGGVNVYKRHLKRRSETKKGGIVDFVRALPVANVALICSKCKQVTRVGYAEVGGERRRVCRKCGGEV